MADDAGADLDQFELQAGQRPVSYLLRQFNAAQEAGRDAGQSVQLQPGRVEGVFALFDVLLGSAELVIEACRPTRLHRHICDDETHAGKQLARAPLDLCNHTALLLPRRRLIVEVVEKSLHLGLGGPPDGPGQSLRDHFLEHRVCGQPDGIGILRLLQPFIDRGDCIGGVGPEEAAPKVAAC